MSEAGGLGFALRALRHRDFRVFWMGALASNTGTWLSNLAVPYVLFQLTHSAVWVSMATVGQILPSVLLSPWGGSLADRHDRRRLLIVTQAGMAVAAAVLWVLSASGSASPWAMVAALSVTGLFNGANMPVWQAFTNDLVPRADLRSAVALNSMQFQAARALGPMIAGTIIALLSPSWAFGLNALSFACVLLALVTIRSRPQPVTTARTSVLRDFASALRYITGQPGIQIAIVLSMLVGLFGNPIFTFTVVFAGAVFHVGAIGLGLMNGALGFGCLLAAPLVAGSVPGLTLGRLTRLALPLYGVAIGGFALAPSFLTGIVLLVVTGACFMSLLSSANNGIQMIVAAPMRGRVIAVRFMFFTAAVPLGSLIQGWQADRCGPRFATMTAGAALVLSGLILSVLGRGRWLRRLDDPNDDTVIAPHDSLRASAVPICGTTSSAMK